MKSTLLSLLLAGIAVSAVVAADPVSPGDAARLQAKLDRIAKNPTVAPRTPIRTSITESEVNSYLRLEMGKKMPAGLQDPWVTLLDAGKVSGRAVVDLARVAQSRKNTGALDPFSYMTGSLPVTVEGILRTQNGIGTFTLESASVSGVPVPAWMIQEMVTYYSKSETTPQGVTLDKPFPLPSGIREIQLARGQAVIVQ